jgi:protein gp37
MLEPVQLDLRGISWVICGGESGPRARYMPAEWARDVRDQCRAAGVALFVKQMSRREPIPDDLAIREFPAP